MGWVWRDDNGNVDFPSGDGSRLGKSNPDDSGSQCSIRKVVKLQCKTEDVIPGKFIRKCEKTEELLRDCIGRPVESIEYTKEYTEEEVANDVHKGSANDVHKGSFSMGTQEGGGFDFPGPYDDIEALKRSFLGGFNRFFEAAEVMRNGFFHVLRDPYLFDGGISSSFPSSRRKIPIEDRPQTVFPEQNKPDTGLANGLQRIYGDDDAEEQRLTGEREKAYAG